MQWFGAIGQNGLLFSALTFGLSVSLLVVAVASVVGTYFAVVVNSATGAAPRVLLAAVIIPAIVPGMVLGLSLAITFRLVGIPPGLWSIVIGHLAFTVPVVTLVVLTRLRRLDPSLTQASMDLGANGWRTFWHVTFPQLRTAILAAALLTFALSLDDFTITYFNSGRVRTFPVEVFAQKRSRVPAQINVFGTMILLAATVIAVSGVLIERRRQRERA